MIPASGGREGLDLIPQLIAADRTLPVIVMTAWGSVEGAVEAIRRGARDYIEKPWDNTRLIATLRAQVELGQALRRSNRLESENRLLRRDGVPQMIAESRAMEPVLQMMERVGPSDANVLVTGEHGTGKEVVARWLHRSSPRAEFAGRTYLFADAAGRTAFEKGPEIYAHPKFTMLPMEEERP